MSALYDTFKAKPMYRELVCCYLYICPNTNACAFCGRNKEEEKIENERSRKKEKKCEDDFK